MVTEHYRRLPSTDFLLERPAVQEAVRWFGRVAVRDEARRLLEESRRAIAAGQMPPSSEELAQALVARVQRRLAPTLRPVLNATGVIIHTNLGRAPLSQAAQEAMLAVAAGYSALEYDLAAGTRGSRYVHAERLLCELSGAEAALVVNNNAAAVTLVLRAVAAGREVVISRGELVEIGGGFRVPEILAQSGARLVEVGTTNRTRLSDYRHAVSAETAAFLKVHPSNFRIIGFSETVEPAALVALGRSLTPPRPVIHDLGSGTFLDTTAFGLAHEPTVQESVAAGAIATTFSGDKLLGGPQAGLIVGDKALIAALREQPLTRAIRPDKLTLAALQATLLAYLRGTALQEIPVWQMIAAPAVQLESRARGWADTLSRSGLRVELRPGHSAVGGGSLPGQTLPTTLLAILTSHPDRLAAQLRHGEPPVVARIEDDMVLCDPRTVLPGQDEPLLRALHAAWEAVHDR
jgi:L-seryl-tRNA(Ser) seleniumtransferase